MKPERAFDILFHQLETLPRPDCLSIKAGKQWHTLSSSEVMEAVNAVSLGLLKHGLLRGDKVAIAADSCPAWVIVDLALQQIGAVSVPLYPTCTLEDARYILAHAEVKLAFVGNAALQQKLQQALADSICPLYALNPVPALPLWTELRETGRRGNLRQLAVLRNSIQPEEVFTIIYTSGTTGPAKGVMLSHRNVVSTVVATAAHTRLPTGQCRALSFLPLSHIFERAGVLYYLLTGTGVYFCGVDTLSASLAEVRPHTFSTVPRILEKLHDRLLAKAKELSGWRRRLYLWAIARAEVYRPDQPPRGLAALPHAIADWLVYRKWRAAMGGELRWVNVGSAALQPRLARLLWASGIAVAEGYGMSEAAPVITANPFKAADVRIGSVGIPLPGVQVKLAEDGEILVRGPNVMVGYYKEPDLSAATLRDGWLHTGDIGVLEQGYLRITDRKKEMFKTSNGKYIAPQLLENKLKESAFIDQIMVVGDGQKFAAALIVPLYERLQEWCQEHGIAYTTPSEMRQHPRVLELIEREIKRFNRHFGSWEHIKKFALLEQPWCVDAGELAPTLKLRRKVISQHCQSLIDQMYRRA